MGTRLRQARKAKGWSQATLILRIEQHAHARGLGIASTSSLRVYVSEWENGRRPVSPEYRAILRAVFGLTDVELFDAPGTAPTETDAYQELIDRVDSARALGRSMVEIMTGQTELLRIMDRQVGAASITDQVQAHLARLQEALAFAVLPDARRPIARALAEAASMAAWQALDVGAAERAWRNYEVAKTAAREADDVLYLAHSMGEQAFTLADAGKATLAVQLVQEAQRAGGTRVSPRLAAWLAAAEAELLAYDGQHDACRRALDRAAKLLPTGTAARDADLASVHLNEAHLIRWRGHALAIIGDELAVTSLHEALAVLDPSFVRARAGLHCDLAQAHMVRGEYDEARRQIQGARLLASRTGSVRHRRRLEQIGRAA